MKVSHSKHATTEPQPAGVPGAEGHSVSGMVAGVGAVSGLAAGAAIGAFAGPVGAVAGALIGAAAGAVTGIALAEGADDEEQYDTKLDKDIGVIAVEGGNMGAAPANQPPARIGAFSAGSAGGAGMGTGDDEAPDEGPMPKAD
jgi:hypothetical protein